MTRLDTQHWIGKTGYYHTEDMTFPVSILGIRERFGNIDVNITPINGTGTRWVLRSRVMIDAREVPVTPPP